jgi:hypothetical protein
MPPLPTSLSVVALVVAWLVVLVPMAARRREHVPDSDERSAGFRILRRSPRRRHQRVLSRTAIVSDADERNAGVDAMDEQTLWSEEDDLEPDEWGETDEDEARSGAAYATDADGTADGDLDEDDPDGDLAESLYDTDDTDLDDREDDPADRGRFGAGADDEADLLGEDQVGDEIPLVVAGPADPRSARHPVAARPRTERWAAEADGYPDEDGDTDDGGYAHAGGYPDYPGYPDYSDYSDAADEWEAEHRVAGRRVPGDRQRDELRPDPVVSGDPGRAATADLDPASLRPVPRRHGRGGFDPDAAAKARAYRYRRRRRVTLVLLFATVIFTLVSVFVSRPAWVGTALCAALLVGYLAYLRRQVRIEESIRQRRTARLAQARQVRPDYSREAIRDPYRADPRAREAEPAAAVPSARASGEDRADRWSVPPSQYRAGTVVDLDDDDPAFSDLEHYQPLTYRRASGQ